MSVNTRGTPQMVEMSKPTDGLKNKILNACKHAADEGGCRVEMNIVTFKRFLHCLQYVLKTKLNEVMEKGKQRR